MKRRCPNVHCNSEPSLISGQTGNDPRFKRIIRKGYFYRARDRRKISRYLCRRCGKYFSSSTHSPDYRQKKRDLNPLIQELFASGLSQRRMAIYLRVNSKTIIRKFQLLANRARAEHLLRLENLKANPISRIQFDDLETFEHTKCKPLSVCLAVDQETREIVTFQVSKIPARGLLAKVSRQKYGLRKDERSHGWTQLFQTLVPLITPHGLIESDKNPHYPRFIKQHLPGVSQLPISQVPARCFRRNKRGQLKLIPIKLIHPVLPLVIPERTHPLLISPAYQFLRHLHR